MPELMYALSMDSLELVRLALAADPEAATLPFFEHECEPPLCCAVRLQCSVEIVSLLLDYGADVHDIDIKGDTPLQKLRDIEMTSQLDFDFFGAKCQAAMTVVQRAQTQHQIVEQLLIRNGAMKAC